MKLWVLIILAIVFEHVVGSFLGIPSAELTKVGQALIGLLIVLGLFGYASTEVW